MDSIKELFSGLFPLLFSGAVAGAILSYMTPFLIKKLRDNLRHSKILQYYNIYQKNPKRFAQVQPELYDFFETKAWQSCPCPNCKWLRKKNRVAFINPVEYEKSNESNKTNNTENINKN